MTQHNGQTIFLLQKQASCGVFLLLDQLIQQLVLVQPQVLEEPLLVLAAAFAVPDLLERLLAM
jgi:hypothetical protein